MSEATDPLLDTEHDIGMMTKLFYAANGKHAIASLRIAQCVLLMVALGNVGCATKKETTDTTTTQSNPAPANFEATKAKIQADPHIPAAQKAMLLRQIQEQSAAKVATKP